jgi:hypothetical protein
MKCECINWPDVVHIFNILSVALERIFLILDFWTGVEVLHADTPFHRADRITYE